MSHILHITSAYDQGRIHLYGDTAVAFDTALTDTFAVELFTTTAESFAFTTPFAFVDPTGATTQNFTWGGSAGMSIELMFDPVGQTWYVTNQGRLTSVSAPAHLVLDYPWETGSTDPADNEVGLDATTRTAYSALIVSAPAGQRRQALMNYIISAFTPNVTLRLVKDGATVLTATYNDGLQAYNDGTNFGVTLSNPVSATTLNGVITDGVWTGTIIGGVSQDRTITFTVGPVGADKQVTLDGSLVTGMGFVDSLLLLFPRAIDNLS